MNSSYQIQNKKKPFYLDSYFGIIHVRNMVQNLLLFGACFLHFLQVRNLKFFVIHTFLDTVILHQAECLLVE